MFQSSDTVPTLDDREHVPGELPRPHIVDRMRMQRYQWRHDNTVSPRAPAPGVATEITAKSGEAVGVVTACVYFTTDGSLPDMHATSVPMASGEVRWDVHGGYVTDWCAAIPPQPEGTVVRYRIAGWLAAPDGAQPRPPDMWAHDGQGFWFRFAGDTGITTFAFRVEVRPDPLPSWVHEAIVYQVFPDRFHSGAPGGRWPQEAGRTDLHGGTLRGIVQALPYLEDLGVTCLWLTPITASPTYHRYDTTDHFTVDPALGNNQDLRTLVTAAHERSIKVVLDFVPSHVSSQHPAFRSAQQDPSAHTASWFTFEEWPDRYRMFSGLVPSMPLVDSQQAAARAHLLQSAAQWLREYDVDGFRVDHAIGVSMDFLTDLRTTMRAEKPPAFTVGEVVDSVDCMRTYRGRLDALLDYPLSRALRQTFAKRAWNVRRFTSFLTAHHAYMRDGPGLLSFLDNHDVNRFLFEADGDVTRLKLAALCQFTLGATPVVYYGTEIGLSQDIDIAEAGWGGDAEARRDMPWSTQDQNLELLAFYQRLIQLRKQHPVLWHGSLQTRHVNAAQSTFSYVRVDESGSQTVTAFNLGDASALVPLPANDERWYLALTTQAGIQIQGGAVHLSPQTGAFLAHCVDPSVMRIEKRTQPRTS
jgi:cyclomaltodextrinase / maltogenic alpha-amylase / neopullulanase